MNTGQPHTTELEARALSLVRDGTRVLDDVSFAARPGKVYALLGGNGAGKSTTLLTFLGFLQPSGGEVLVGGRPVAEDVEAARARIAYLPEAASLYGHLDAYENLAYFLDLAGRQRPDRYRDCLRGLRCPGGCVGMMWRIAREEWRLWARSRIVLLAGITLGVLVVLTSILTAQRIAGEAERRAARQASAEATFLAQPDRHPHRMVHYGHYAFRTPPPLAAFDPGVDAVTGQSIFLEGHRQNTAMFADPRAGADLGGFAPLTPANLFQLLLPMLLIVIGHGVLLRERESGTLAVLLAQGQSGLRLTGGKALALAGVAGVFLLPLAGLALFAIARGEAPLTAFGLVGAYALYIAVWGALVLAVSLWVRQRSVALVVPRIGINAASAAIDAPGKIESDLVMLAEQRKLGDGYNASDPACEALKKQVLDQYEAQSVEELPVNWRGVLAGYSEQKLTDLMNDYAGRRTPDAGCRPRRRSRGS